MNRLNAEDVEHRFPRHAQIRTLFKELATELNDLAPESCAKSVAFTELETAAMWFHKAVAEEVPLVADTP